MSNIKPADISVSGGIYDVGKCLVIVQVFRKRWLGVRET
jgi:hypothetical protein